MTQPQFTGYVNGEIKRLFPGTDIVAAMGARTWLVGFYRGWELGHRVTGVPLPFWYTCGDEGLGVTLPAAPTGEVAAPVEPFQPSEDLLAEFGFVKHDTQADVPERYRDPEAWPREYRKNFDVRVYLYEGGHTGLEDDEVLVFSGKLPSETFFRQLLVAVGFA